MIAISFRFLAGRFHATPWGRHVNEGAVEWPPSPWRFLRALVATWKRTLPDLTQDQVEPVLRELAKTPPEFVLPPASTGHTRHYMPWFKKGPDDRTLIFDTFVVVAREPCQNGDRWRAMPLDVRWPGASLDDGQRNTLSRILTNLNTLGRSESWCEATLLDDNETKTHVYQSPERRRRISAPLNGGDPPPQAEIVRLLCSDPDAAFNSEEFTNRTKKLKRTAPLYVPDWHLCAETLWLHKQKWSDPPGSRWVPYVRPRDCFKIKPTARRRGRTTSDPKIQVVRFVLDSPVLPLVTETLPVAEAARRALMSIYGRLPKQNGIRGRSVVFSGKDEDGHPLTGHGHAYYLPTDENGDGRLDHLTVIARMGFDNHERRALDCLRQLNTSRKGEERHPLRLLLLGMGTLEEYCPGPLGLAKLWVSTTPYIATRYAKTRGRDRIDLTSSQARAEFLMANLREQVRLVLAGRDGDPVTVKISPEWDDNYVFRLTGRDNRRELRPLQFKRFRSKRGDDGGRRLDGAFRVEFPVAVRGPLVLGHSSHFGMGLFMPSGVTDGLT